MYTIFFIILFLFICFLIPISQKIIFGAFIIIILYFIFTIKKAFFNDDTKRKYYISQLERAQKLHAQTWEYQQQLRKKIDEIDNQIKS